LLGLVLRRGHASADYADPVILAHHKNKKLNEVKIELSL